MTRVFVMHYALAHFPRADMSGVDQIRRRYDPTVNLIDPHVAVMFPVPDTVGEETLLQHTRAILRAWQPFQVRTGGFQKSWDHWLLLTLREGDLAVKDLHSQLYSGKLASYRREDIPFVPHIGLGLFVLTGADYEFNNPKRLDFDEHRHAAALREAEALELNYSFIFDSVNLLELADDFSVIRKRMRLMLGGA